MFPSSVPFPNLQSVNRKRGSFISPDLLLRFTLQSSPVEMSVYKLYYFNVRGRGEICRLAFAAANIEYEDIRLDGEDWVKEKECK